MVFRPGCPPGKLQEKEPGVRVQLLKVRILIRDDLRKEGIEVTERKQQAPELLSILLIESFEPFDGRVDDGVHPGVVRRCLRGLRLEEDLAELLDFILVVNVPLIELGLEVVKLPRFDLFANGCHFVIRLECVENLIPLVHEI